VSCIAVIAMIVAFVVPNTGVGSVLLNILSMAEFFRQAQG